jgi:DNA ligase (NAD+)
MAAPKDPKLRIVQLRKELNEHNFNYHALNSPVLTDAEYDRLFMELVELEKLHPELKDVNSPTARVGFPSNSSFQKVKHRAKMLSLDNANSAKDVLKFFEKGETVAIEPKIDGFSLELTYENGVLVQAATRGDGMTGDDVTANARTIQTVPLVLHVAPNGKPISIRVRGEVYMTFSVFNRLNLELEQTGDEPFANTRNAASGTIKLKDPAAVARRNLSFVAYGTPNEIKGILTQNDLTEWLLSLGFSNVTMLPTSSETSDLPPTVVEITTEKEMEAVIEEWDKYRKQLDLATDGLVLKVNSLVKQRELGEGTRAPNWAVAYKFPPERKSTKLNAITVTVGKTGKLTPVAELEPLTLAGTVVTYASLCNADEIARLKCNVGDEVWVEKSAEIIPKVMGVNKKHSKTAWKMPEKCPCCGTAVVREEGKVDYYCPNKDCKDQIFARLRHALGKACLDIDGCGEVTVKELMAHGVKSLSDFFAIEDLSFLKTAARKKLTESREQAKHATLWRKIHALGIDGIGRTVSQELAGRWSALYSMFDDLVELKRVLGEVDYNSFVEFMDKNADELDKLDALGVTFENDSKSAGPLSGKYFVITGSLVSGRRDDVIRRIEEAGGIVKGAVTKNVHYLVAGADCGRTKTDAAKKLGTIVITEEELYQLMGKPMPVITADVDPDRQF